MQKKYTMVESILSYLYDIWTVAVKRKALITEKWRGTSLERMDNNMLKWYGHVLRMRGNIWSKRKFT
jgi:hypothetical protein